MASKTKEIQDLLTQMGEDTSMEIFGLHARGGRVNVGLINHFKLHDHIPNKWFDWKRTASAPIMIIGQDWRPYSVLSDFISDFDPNKLAENDYYLDFLFKDFSSRTERFILRTVEDSYRDKFGFNLPRDRWD